MIDEMKQQDIEYRY